MRMDAFEIPIDNDKFRRTNGPWNALRLNDPWSVGYVSQLIELKPFAHKQEWMDFYYEMGAYRLKRIAVLEQRTQNILTDESLIRTNKALVYELPPEIIAINKLNGRTREELNKKGQILFETVKSSIVNITQEECVKSVIYRVIGETWNGIILREKNTIKTLQQQFSTVQFEKKNGAFDYRYAVDYEMYQENKLICAIQIKPKSYTYSTPYIAKAKRTNKRKNNKYRQEFKVPVFDIISSANGVIYNKSELNHIHQLMK